MVGHCISLGKVEQGTEEWKKLRMQGVGASDAAAAAGLSAYKTRMQLYLEKTGLDNPEHDFFTQWFMGRGTALEAPMRQYYSNITGRVVRMPEHLLQHPEKKFMLYSPDGFSEDDGELRLQEFKTATRSHGWGEEGSEDVPLAYNLQVQHAMFVTGAKIADLVVSIGGAIPKIYPVRANEQLQSLLVESEEEFWGFVQNNTPPPPQTPAEFEKAGLLATNGGAITSPDIENIVSNLRSIKERIKLLQELEEDAKEAIKVFMAKASADFLINGSGNKVCSWREYAGAERVDTDFLKKNHPEIYSSAIKRGKPYRRFILS